MWLLNPLVQGRAEWMVAREVGAGFKIGLGSAGLILSASSRPSRYHFRTWAQLLAIWSLTSAVVGYAMQVYMFLLPNTSGILE